MRVFLIRILGLAAALACLPIQANVLETDQIEVELIAETTNVVPGETLWLAIRLDPIEHWHTYWKFGGDSGEATRAVDWRLPEGAEAGEIIWPMPEWTPFPGSNLVTFTYEREVFLPLPVSVPASFDGDTFSLSTTIEWQVCDEICIPGDGEFSLTLPVGTQAQPDPVWQDAFTEARASVPRVDPELIARFNTHDEKINVMVEAPDDRFAGADNAYFFPDQRYIMQYAPLREVMLEDDRVQVTTAAHRRFTNDMDAIHGVIAVVDDEGNWQSYEVNPQITSIAWDESIEVELIAETTNAVPGETLWLALRLNAAAGWHTYWKAAGDSGEPTELTDWAAPDGTEIGAIQWPAPHWLPFPGSDLVNYGYEGQVVLPIPVQVPANLEADNFTVSTLAKWYVCELICIPGEHRLELTLPTAPAPELDAAQAPLFDETRSRFPITDHNIQSLIAVAGERVSLGFESPEQVFAGVTDAYFFPDRRRIIANGPLRDISIQPGLLQITHEQPRRMLTDLSDVYGVLVVEDASGDRTAYEFVNPAANAITSTITPFAASAEDGGSGAGPLNADSLLLFMLAALAGGIILNLMPCVFPVLSLKALSLVNNAGATRSRQRLDGLVYAAGVIAAFLVLATILVALRAGGEMVGWAFQLQEPWFVALLIYLFFLMALSLSGVFEFGTGLTNIGGGLTRQEGHPYRSSFFTGVLATVVASPCTAPFMGPALGFALTQPWIVAMLVFIALGLGMALPILLLSFMPLLSHYLPKPGSWMVTFRQFLAFPLYATAAWLLWVLGIQVGVNGMALVAGSLVLLALACWLYQKRHTASRGWRTANAAIAVISLVTALYVLQTPLMQPQEMSVTGAVEEDGSGESGRNVEAFSAVRLQQLRDEGRPVFVNMTAAWCITCLANEQTTLGSQRVQNAMREQGITYLKGDWTNEDPEITAILNRYDRPSVPLYLLYPADRGSEPLILPQILTPSIMVEAFQKI
ncbi:MAG: protein-disulfide reductase DsbD domain-containing protein [Pseudohongiellaceae bacterium]